MFYQFIKLLPILVTVNGLFPDVFILPDWNTEFNGDETYSSAIAISPNGRNMIYTVCYEMQSRNKKTSDAEEKDSHDNGSGEIICDLKLETLLVGSETYLRSCNDVQLISKRGYPGFETLQFISETIVVIKYTDYHRAKRHYKIIDLINCTVALDFHFNVVTEDFHTNWQTLVPHDKYFEFFATGNELCRGLGGCRVNYTFDGELIGQSNQFPHHEFLEFDIIYVNDSAPQKGYYALGLKNRGKREDIPDMENSVYLFVSHFDSSGTEKELMSQHYIPIGNIYISTFTNSYELLSGCWHTRKDTAADETSYEDELIQCVQFDVTGMKFNVTLKVDHPIDKLAVHTLPNGEVIVAVGNMKLDNNSIAHVDSLQIFKIGANGFSGQSLLVRNIGLKSTKQKVSMRFTENLDNELCIHIACSSIK